MARDLDAAITDHRLIVSTLMAAASNQWRDLDITMAQLKGIFVLHQSGQTPVSGLAERLGVGLPAASLLADRLVQSGMAERLDDAADRRRVLIRLTPKGEQLSARLRQGSRALLQKWMAELSPEDFAALSRGLRALAAAASRHARKRQAALTGGGSADALANREP